MQSHPATALLFLLVSLGGLAVSDGLSIPLASGKPAAYRVDRLETKSYVSIKEPVAVFRLATAEDVAAWKTQLVWDDPDVNEGQVTFCPEFDGTAQIHLEGAPCFVNFWRELPIDLKYGDEIVVCFFTKQPLHPVGGFEIRVGPLPNAALACVTVGSAQAGEHLVSLPIWHESFPRGTTFGIRASIWPGKRDIYIQSISILRPVATMTVEREKR